jgi:8-oxoguanine deaminase
MSADGSRERTLLVRNADVLVTMDSSRREIRGGGLYAEGNRITAVGTTGALPQTADVVLDLAGHVVVPGLVNTHHHMFQSLTRALPRAQDASLFGWLEALYPVWGGITPEMLGVSTLTAMAELILSGCTTSSDHLYLFPNGCHLEDTLQAAAEIGMRFHAARGSMSVGRSSGGLPPDNLVEPEARILADTQAVIERHNDPSRFSMQRIVVAPCSPFSVSRDLMRESASLARSLGVSLHTHLAENDSDVAYCLEKFGMTPAHYAEDLGWTGPDVWHAHCVKLDAEGIDLFGRTGTGVSHCPCSNMRLGSGIAPVRKMLARRVNVGLGVDGSASNDTGNMMGEARQALLLQRVVSGPSALTARQALELATRGGARVLGRDDIGALEPGMAADFAAFDMRCLGMAGAQHDPVAALVLCAPQEASWVVINGKVVVGAGRFHTIDLPAVVARHIRLSLKLASG